MCPLRLIPKLFLFDEDEVPAEYRAQRILNKVRIPEIANYILDNQKDYVFSSLTASVDGGLEFVPFEDSPQFRDIGKLQISLDAKFLINDGQHRRAAIEEALKIAPELGFDCISIVFFQDEGLKHSQQIFADLNRHAVNTTSSLGILYDYRDQLATVTKQIIQENELLNRYTDNERVSLPKLSPKMFALSHIFNTNLKLLSKSKGDLVTDEEVAFLKDFWKTICASIVEYQQVANKEMSPSELRSNYVVGHGVFLEAIGLVGNHLHEEFPTEWTSIIEKLSTFDWTRGGTSLWAGRSYGPNGRINKNSQTVQLTANMIKLLLNVPLRESEQKLEEAWKAGR